MKTYPLYLAVIVSLFYACESSKSKEELEIQGTWKLQTGTLIVNGDTTVTDYTTDQSFIKIINDSHFAFLRHDLEHGKDSTYAIYFSGGGTYTLNGTDYTENLEYCTSREWEGHSFHFQLSLDGDTLIQQGIEEIPEQGLKQYNIEKYLKVE
ncbi:hypothetical protein [Jiulongibacter sp. NS-SX5]|uniref:hypothetical protein n=1 Tax=Jiulongibacter sp. NS-SX5 TaxID=3463854 RepID=UPI004057D00B